MATPEKGHVPSEQVREKEEQSMEKRSRPRKSRRKPYQMTAVVVAQETALLPEPLRASVVAVAQAIIRFCRHAWHELTATGVTDSTPRLLLSGRHDADQDE